MRPPKKMRPVSPSVSDRINMGEARGQVASHEADGIRKNVLVVEGPSDLELLVKIVEARYNAYYDDSGVRNRELGRQAALTELLRKAVYETPVQPPTHGRFAISLLPREYQQIIFGDIEEQYPNWVKEWGPSRAAFLYWWQLIWTAIRIAWPRTRRWRYVILLICVARGLFSLPPQVLEILLHYFK